MTNAPARTFGELIERHELEIFRYALRLTGRRHDADDVFQETFLAAFRAWPPPRRGNERAWLYKIATNRAIDRERRGRGGVADVADLGLAAPGRGGTTPPGLPPARESPPTGGRAGVRVRDVPGA